MREGLYIASHSLRKFAFVSVVVLFAAVFVSSANAQVSIDWVEQFGSTDAEDDIVFSIDTDSNVYVAGVTTGVLPGQTNIGDSDAFLSKYDTSGTEIWTRQFGTVEADQVFAVFVDSSGIYVTGITDGTFSGQTSAGGSDVFLRKYNASGTEQWTRQFGTESTDEVFGIDADASSNIYLVGFVDQDAPLPGQVSLGGEDAFVRKYDSDGNVVWTRQFGSAGNDEAHGIFVDSTDVYIGGFTTGTFSGEVSNGGVDAFIRRYDLDGTENFTDQFGTAGLEEVSGVSVDSEGVYVVGFTGGTLPGETSVGDGDAFIRKYDINDGSVLWTHQFGSTDFDQAFSVKADDNTGVYVTGVTDGAFSGFSNLGERDIFVRKYASTTGTEIWTTQLGTSGFDEAFGVSITSNELYVVGSTEGTYAGEINTGGLDAVIINLAQDDTDGDGIFDEIDLLPATFSDDFADDATTTGSITTRGGQTLTIQDATSSGDGVIATADISGSPPKARIIACGGTKFDLSAGDSVVITCGSVVAQVVDGDGVEIEFIADDGTVVSTTLTVGSEIIFETDTATFFVPEGGNATIIIEGTEIVLESGESFELPRNHGQFVSSQDDKKNAAHSRLGMPEQSKGHNK